MADNTPNFDYITEPDIRVNVIKQFALTDHITRANLAVEDLAETLGIREVADIETNPVHWKVKEYAKAFLIIDVCADKMTTNNVDVAENEKYAYLHDIWLKKLSVLKQEITPAMMTGTVDEMRDRGLMGTGILFRG